jgi:hypothetical protein
VQVSQATSSFDGELNPAWIPQSVPYPQARRDPSLSDVFPSEENGEVHIPDPYGWLNEDPQVSKEVMVRTC